MRLTRDRLDELGRGADRTLPCRSCVRWELPAHNRSRLRAEEAAAEKDAWVATVLREWGSCGRAVLVDDVPVGFALYAPAEFVPGSAGPPTAPVSPDAVLLTTLHVAPDHAGGGLGRMLVQGMARDLVTRGVRAVEAFGDATGHQACLVPADFLSAVGFRTHVRHPLTPRMRMELRASVTWKDELEAALERLARLRPAPVWYAPVEPLRMGQRTVVPDPPT